MVDVQTTALQGALADSLLKNFSQMYKEGWTSVGLSNSSQTCIMPVYFVQQHLQKVLDFEVRSDDVWVISYPRSGTTWTQEMTWLLGNGLNYEGAKKDINERFPYFELSCLVDELQPENSEAEGAYFDDPITKLQKTKGQRFIKSHLPWFLLPTQIREKKPKIIYVARNPKDVCVSFFHQTRLLDNYAGDLEEFTNAFLEDIILYGPFWDHILEFWKRRDDPNILFLKYEDMKKDLLHEAQRVATFIGKPLSKEDAPRLIEHLSFQSMKKNPAVNYEAIVKAYANDDKGSFIRKGEVGAWKGELTPEVVDQFDNWTKKHLEGTGLIF